ncbi:proton-coupled folate transporter-like [Pectinophora gossypiella]|uniref:proton-coupled folate transporter-like n=1 Tax=Pectinophora gossypiella TaxID=13191 RepID=UPI00214EF40B|nr:proton-coupled folate transporter-like [Pectinophora gossypiella]
MTTETKNGTELSVTKMETNGQQITDTRNQKEQENLSTMEKAVSYTKKFFQFFTVEPFLLCYILPNIISSVAVYKLNMEKACLADLNYSQDICDKAISGDASDNITTDALNGAQVLVAEMTAWRQPLQSGIPAIMILFVGAWSDRTGNRKALMLIPLLGELVTSILMILAVYYFIEWPLWATGLIEGLPSALSGGISIALMGSYSYIADVTSVDSRTFRIGIVGVIVTLGIPLGSSISGILTEAVGYYGIFGIGFVLYLIGFVHTYYRIHDVRKTKTEGKFWDKLVQFFHPRNVWDTLSLVIMARGRRLAQILLIIWAHIVLIGPVFGEANLVYLYTLKKYSMDIIEFSLFSTYSTLVGIAGTAVAVTLFSKKMKMHDAVLGVIATACKVASSFVYGLAPTKQWFYSGPAFDFFGNTGVTAIRSLGTKVVKPNEVGKMCSLIGFIEAIVPVIYTPIYSKIYAKTIETFPGTFYIVGGAMTIPAFFIFIILYVLYKRQQRDVVKNPEEKEKHAHENAVTSL